MAQLRLLIEQCCQIFEIYGKTASDAATRLEAFASVLEPFTTEEISYAFKVWLNEKKKFPMPADIREIALEKKKNNQSRPAPFTYPDRPKTPPVPWAYKDYRQIVDAGLMDQLRTHLASMDEEKRSGYIKYLKDMCAFPRDFEAA